MSTQSLEETVRQTLVDTGPVEQEELVDNVAQECEDDRDRVLGALRVLMEKDEVSYTIDWDLQFEDD
jgi:hypothetical protein